MVLFGKGCPVAGSMIVVVKWPASWSGVPRTESPPPAPAAVQEYVTFYEARRSGNVGIAVTPAAAPAHEEMAAAERILATRSYGESRETRTERPGLESRAETARTAPRSQPARGGVPASTTSHKFRACGTADSATNEDEILARILACDDQCPAPAEAISSPTAAMHRPRVDPRLSRLVDAWPGLPSTTREAVAAMIDSRPHAAARVVDAARTVSVPHRKPAREKAQAASASRGTNRRRTRKPASPPQ